MMNATHQPTLSAIVLAAGKGTRMKSELPKVMHHAAGKPMVTWVVKASRDAGATAVVLVVGHMAQLVEDAFGDTNPACHFVRQNPQLGTGHAVDQARALAERGALGEHCFVLCGDGPLIRAETLQKLLQKHLAANASASLATSVVQDATGYGRIQRDANGNFQRIVEQKDATTAQLAIREINPSYYLFRTVDLFDALTRVTNQNASGEYYITDVFELLLKDGRRVEVVDAVPPEDVLSVNTPEQLAEVDAILRQRLGHTHAARSHA